MTLVVTSKDLKKLIQDVREVSAWSDLVNVFERSGGAPRPDWQLPVIACQAVGGDPADALPAAAAVACLQISIMLVDDILDDDERGLHRRVGPGRAANLALAFQSAAFKLLLSSNLSDSQKSAAIETAAHAALATAYGQQLDDQSLPGEENYWAVVSAKSTPFYGSCYKLGAIVGGADEHVVDALYEFGVLIGEIIQIQDDLEDALVRPANPDWMREGNNLLIIYGRSAKYAQRDLFDSLLPMIAAGENEALVQAQQLLVSSGAVSYAFYHLVQRYQQTWKIIENIELSDPSPITKSIDDFGQSLARLLGMSGVQVDMALLRSQDLGLVESQREPT